MFFVIVVVVTLVSFFLGSIYGQQWEKEASVEVSAAISELTHSFYRELAALKSKL